MPRVNSIKKAHALAPPKRSFKSRVSSQGSKRTDAVPESVKKPIEYSKKRKSQMVLPVMLSLSVLDAVVAHVV